METNNITNLLGSKRFKLGKNTNTNIQLQLENTTKNLIEYDALDIVNLQELFEQERNECSKYRINGKLNIYVSGEVATASTVYLEGKYSSYSWDPLFYGNPPVAPSNWVMQITYPSDSDIDFVLKSRTNSGLIASNAFRGLQYETLSYVNINNDNYLTIIGIQNHNLSVGDSVYIYSYNAYNPLQGIHKVKSLGVNSTDEKKHLTLETIVNPTNVPLTNGNFVKIVNPSFDDVNVNNLNSFIKATATDLSGNTTGSYTPQEVRYTTITTSLPNDLLIGDFIEIRDYPTFYLNGIWKVSNILNPNKFVIRATVSNTKGVEYNPTPTPNFRRIEGTPSEYYVRKFEVLTSNNYEVYPASFSTNIYPDVSDISIGLLNDTYLFQFNKDVNVGNLIDNRNGPISELYYTIIKRSGNLPFNWSDVTSDWEFNYKDANTINGLEFISKNNSSGIGTIEKFSARTETIDTFGNGEILSGDKYIGDFVEFNRLEIKETTISDIIHRFGPNTNPNGNGYYYKPFKKLQIRVYSNFTEQAESIDNIVDIPNNYVTYPDKSIAWKDLLTVGYYEEGSNGVNYPFLNASHYFYFNHNLFVRKQVPQSTMDFSSSRFRDVTKDNLIC